MQTLKCPAPGPAACRLRQVAPNSCGGKQARPAVRPPCIHLSTHLPSTGQPQPLHMHRQAPRRHDISGGHRVSGGVREAGPAGQGVDMMWVTGPILCTE